MVQCIQVYRTIGPSRPIVQHVALIEVAVRVEHSERIVNANIASTN